LVRDQQLFLFFVTLEPRVEAIQKSMRLGYEQHLSEVAAFSEPGRVDHQLEALACLSM
jgi:hypothetical protein